MANAFWQTVVRLDAARLTPEIAVRNTVGLVVPLAIGALTGHSAASAVVALGALNVCYSDSREAYAVRGRRMLQASVLVSLAVVFGALSAQTYMTAALAAMIWAFCGGMMIVLGSRASDLGTVTLVTLIVFGAKRLSVEEALSSGALAFLGGLIQTALSVIIWPVRPYGPERDVIAALYRTLAEIAVSPAGAASAPPATGEVVRANESLASLEADRSLEAERLIFLLSQGERLRLSILTLRRLARRLGRNSEGQPAAQELADILNEAGLALQAIAMRAETKNYSADQAESELLNFQTKLAAFPPVYSGPVSAMTAALVRDARRQLQVIAGQLRSSARLTSAGSIPSGERQVAGQPQDVLSRRARLLANLTLESVAFRHALRLAICVGIAAAIGHGLGLARAYWLPMTVAIVLKPDFVGTVSRGILRVAGTLGGLILATAIYYLLPDTLAVQILLLASFMLLLRWFGPTNYGIFVAAVSGTIVLLMALTGVDPKDVIAPRTINTSLGGLLAIAAYWIWPTWERTQISSVLADMMDAYRSYFQQLMRVQYDSSAKVPLDPARNAGRLARSNAEASVSRFESEPGVSPAQAALLNEILVSSHAFARAAMAIESDPGGARSLQFREAIQEFSVRTERVLEVMAASLRNGGRLANRLPDVREAWAELEKAAGTSGLRHSLLLVETDRVATAVNTLREQVAKWCTLHAA